MKVFLGLLIAIVSGTTLSNASEPAAADIQTFIKNVDAHAFEEFSKEKIGGLTVGFISKGQLVWTKSYGMADMEKHIPASAATIYRIGSITKQFTALMLLQLVERGKVRLSDPVEKYLPEVKTIQNRFSTAPITLFQLATHTSGLAREPNKPERYLAGPTSDWEHILINALPETSYEFEPGTKFSYSNIGYAILGAALSRAANQPYVDYVKQNIFLPLGMRQTFFEPSESMGGNLAKGYVVSGDKIDTATPEAGHKGRGYKVPNGAIYTNVSDLARFMAFEMGEGPESVLKRQSLDDNWNRVIVGDSEFIDAYGIGFQVSRQGDNVVYGHSGAVQGYLAQAFFSRKTLTGVIVLSNDYGEKLSERNILWSAFTTH